MARFASLSALGLAALLAACETTTGALPAPPPGPGSAARFRLEDFAWSEGAGRSAVAGKLNYRQGQTRFTCAGSSVILTPETPWTRERMLVLYLSDERAALPTDDVRARTPSAPPGDDYSGFIRRTACDPQDRYSFANVPAGAWYAITTARPVGGKPDAPTIAVMRRIVTSGGKIANGDL